MLGAILNFESALDKEIYMVVTGGRCLQNCRYCFDQRGDSNFVAREVWNSGFLVLMCRSNVIYPYVCSTLQKFKYYPSSGKEMLS